MATSTASEALLRRGRRAMWIAWIALAACRAPLATPGPPVRFEFEHAQMGTLFRIVLYAPDAARAASAAERAFARLDELDAALSDYDADSELSRLSRAGAGPVPTPWIPVSADLGRVLAQASEVSQLSEGAFDVTCGVATRLWRRAIRERELPEPAALEALRGSRGWRALEISPGADRVRWTEAGLRLDLGGIAKGYALDCMLAVLEQRGFPSALVDGGGDIVVGDPPPGARGWRIELATPTPAEQGACVELELSRAAVATSGDVYRAATIDGLRYSHIVDPRSALGLTSARGASVIAPDGIRADALATAATVLGPRDSPRLWESTPNCHFRIVSAGERGIECVESPGFAGFRAR